MVALTHTLLSRATPHRLDPLCSLPGNLDRAMVVKTMGTSPFLGRRQRVRRVLRCDVLFHGPLYRGLVELQRPLGPFAACADHCSASHVGQIIGL